MKKFFLIVWCLTFMLACSRKEPAVATLKKDKAIEISFETQRLSDTAVLLLTHQNVYIKGVLVRAQVKRDTLPALGDSLQNTENDNGERSVMRVPKEYEFFVTVK